MNTTPKRSSPPTVDAVEGDKEQVFTSSTLPQHMPTRQAICLDCEYFRAVRLTSRLRTFCALSGEKLQPETPACTFGPGCGGDAA